ncbi:MAG: hypothetical protein QG623_445 [Patescibacteria group bacterium]|nr:hypothetical protein [Patescibacteria group bacterium]
MDKVSKQNKNSIYKVIDAIAGIAFIAGLIFAALYSVDIKIAGEVILALIFGGLSINLILLFKLKSNSILKETLQSFWALY